MNYMKSVVTSRDGATWLQEEQQGSTETAEAQRGFLVIIILVGQQALAMRNATLGLE